ncbi:MAG: response regulator [Lachnospiraceae bacterium]|nr:response regulator [Lachnospiraceae bacterium]
MSDNSYRYRILIADDEPLVQIGLKSMLSKDFPEYEIAGSAANGRAALEMIESLRPDIVISDIKMPVMTGLELIKGSNEKFGKIPVFIMLTAFEDFEMVRTALSNDAVDYLVKIELNKDTLGRALNRAIGRIEEYRGTALKAEENPAPPQASLEEFRQKFMIKLFNHLIPDRETFNMQASDNKLDFSYNRYILVYGQIISSHASGREDDDKLLTLYSSCLNMAREIVEKYAPCHTVSNDIRHFTLVFYFNEDKPVADVMEAVSDGIENARSMIDSYFNVDLHFGIGTAVTDPLDIPTSFEEARTAEAQADENTPIRLFSHIVGSNRRSGKDRLIASIQEYIDENLNGKLQLNEVAEVFGLSPAYLSSIFKKNTEVGFSEYVYTKKIEKAKEMLLSDDMKIYEVADALSFESAYYFSKVFKKVEGISPREFVNSKM